MKRILWSALVPGIFPVVLMWLALAAVDTFLRPRPELAVVDILLCALNAAAWEQARRRRAKARP